MTDQSNMQDELAALRAEVQSLQENRRKQDPVPPEDAPTDAGDTIDPDPETPEMDASDQADFEQAVGDLANRIETDMAARPALTILGALVLGVLLGAAFKR
jgi:hypothetical protein